MVTSGDQFNALKPNGMALRKPLPLVLTSVGNDCSALVLRDCFYGHDFHQLLSRTDDRKTGATVFVYHVALILNDMGRFPQLDTSGKVLHLEVKRGIQIELRRDRALSLRQSGGQYYPQPKALGTT